MSFLPGSFGHLGLACGHKPAELFHGVDDDGKRCLSSSTDCDGESRCRHFSTPSMKLLMTSAFTVYVGMSSCRLVYAVASNEGSMLLKAGLNINVVCKQA